MPQWVHPLTAPNAGAGIASHVLPSRILPPHVPRTILEPPFCLWKYATPATMHWMRIERAQPGSIGRASGPLSPPVMIQWMVLRGPKSIGPRSGSALMKRMAEGIWQRMSFLDA